MTKASIRRVTLRVRWARFMHWIHTSPPGDILKALANVLVLIAVLIVLVIVLQLAVAFNSRNRTDEIGGCRAAFRAELIDGPTYQALKATAIGDKDGVRAAIRKGNPERYTRLITLSRTDPAKFLTICKTENPGG